MASIHGPKHLSGASRTLYRRVVDFGLDGEPHALEVLRVGLEARDRCEQARSALAAHGPVYADRFGAPR